MVTQDPTSHRTMDRYDNLAPSASPNYSPNMPHDDPQKDSPVYQMTQPLDDFRQAEPPYIQSPVHYDYTSRGPTPLASIDSQSDGSETSFYASNTRNSISPGPTPDTSHLYKTRHHVPQRRPQSISPSSPGTQNNQLPGRSHPYALPVGAGSYAGAPQSIPAFWRLAPETAQSIQPHVSSNVCSFSPPVPQCQAPEHAPSSFTGNFSGIDAPSTQNTQVNFQTQYALENQPTVNACPSYPVWPATSSSPATLNAQNPAAEPAYTIPEQSSHTHRGSLASLVSEDSFLFPSSSGSQDEFVSDATPFLGQASPDNPSQIAGNALPQQGTSSLTPGVSRRKRRTGTRKQNPNPKDPKAAQRLKKQRQTNDHYTRSLFELFVPPTEGTAETVPKMDQLRIIEGYARAFVKSHDGSIQHARTAGNSFNRSRESSNYQG